MNDNLEKTVSGTDPLLDKPGKLSGVRLVVALVFGGIVGWILVGFVLDLDSNDGTSSASQSVDVSSRVSVPAGWNTYTNEVSGFSISYPNDWVVYSINETALEAIEAMGREALETDAEVVPPALSAGLPLEDGRLSPNVQIVLTRIPDPASTSEMLGVTQEAMSRVYSTYEKTSETITVIGGREVGIVHASFAMSDLSEILGAVVEGRWWMVHLVVPIDGVGWQVTCGTDGVTAEDAQENFAICETVVRTLAIG